MNPIRIGEPDIMAAIPFMEARMDANRNPVTAEPVAIVLPIPQLEPSALFTRSSPPSDGVWSKPEFMLSLVLQLANQMPQTTGEGREFAAAVQKLTVAAPGPEALVASLEAWIGQNLTSSGQNTTWQSKLQNLLELAQKEFAASEAKGVAGKEPVSDTGASTRAPIFGSSAKAVYVEELLEVLGHQMQNETNPVQVKPAIVSELESYNAELKPYENLNPDKAAFAAPNVFSGGARTASEQPAHTESPENANEQAVVVKAATTPVNLRFAQMPSVDPAVALRAVELGRIAREEPGRAPEPATHSNREAEPSAASNAPSGALPQARLPEQASKEVGRPQETTGSERTAQLSQSATPRLASEEHLATPAVRGFTESPQSADLKSNGIMSGVPLQPGALKSSAGEACQWSGMMICDAGGRRMPAFLRMNWTREQSGEGEADPKKAAKSIRPVSFSLDVESEACGHLGFRLAWIPGEIAGTIQVSREDVVEQIENNVDALQERLQAQGLGRSKFLVMRESLEE